GRRDHFIHHRPARGLELAGGRPALPPTRGGRVALPGVDRPLRRSRWGWVSGVSNAVRAWLGEHGLEGRRGFGGLTGGHARDWAQGSLRAAGVRLRRQASARERGRLLR